MLPLMLAVLVLTACAGKEPATTPTPPVGGQEALGVNPTPTTDATVEPPPTTTSKPPTLTLNPQITDLVNVPLYPNTHRAYAEAVLAAWKAGNLDRLGDLTTPMVQDQIISIPGPPDMDWDYQMCDGVAGGQYCSFTNDDGETVTLKITTQFLGQAHAATQVLFN
jgi:hypothetical protein